MGEIDCLAVDLLPPYRLVYGELSIARRRENPLTVYQALNTLPSITPPLEEVV